MSGITQCPGTIWARVGGKQRLRVDLTMAGYCCEKGKEPFCQAGKRVMFLRKLLALTNTI